jgi:hypothetical protein
LSNLRAFIVVNSSTSARIRRTVNGGATWGTVYEDTTDGSFLNSVFMFDQDNGYATGNPMNGDWILLKTSTAGTSWISAAVLPQIGTETGFANSVEWFNINTGWFGTNNSRIYRTTDAGFTWSASTSTFTNSRTISFFDAFFGMAGGDNMDITTDGGLTWTQSASQLQNDIKSSAVLRLDAPRWYFITGSQVHKSADQGFTISLDYEQSEDYENISMKIIQLGDNYWICGYAVGENGIISKYTELVTVTHSEDAVAEYPSDFILKQNYPNPFNPSTTIEYSLPVSADVKITIYNMLGQEVRTLLNESKIAGSHSVTWNARDKNDNSLSSGIYFYELRASGLDGKDFRQIHKMVLLK